MSYKEIIAVFTEIRTEHINILCGQNVELFNAEIVVRMGYVIWLYIFLEQCGSTATS